MQYRVLIDSIEYGMGDIFSGEIERPLFDELSIGNACMSMFTVTVLLKSVVPTAAQMVPQAFVDGAWQQLGVFYIDERSAAPNGMTKFISYDSMVKADAIWVPGNDLVFPMAMNRAASVIAGLMGVSIDSRTVINANYSIDYPANDYTLRDVLGYIAAANGGNWIITRENKLLLVPLVGSLPDEPDYLADENGDAITFGGVRILV